MKIVVSATEQSPDSAVDPRFGRTPWLLIHDTERDTWSSVSNQGAQNALQGAGVQTAETVCGCQPDSVISGRLGPKAFSVLSAAGIPVYGCTGGSAREAVQALRDGQLQQIDRPSGP